MSTRSYTSLRGISACLATLLLFGASFSEGAEGQATTPLATASYATTLTPPSGLGQVFQMALDSFGDLLVVDYAKSALYEYPVNGGAVITLVAAGGLGGGYNNPGIAIDSNNNLYLEGNFNNCLLRFPYDTAARTWTGLSTVTAANSTPDICPNDGSGTSPYIFAQGDTPNTAPYYIQPWAITATANNNLIITTQNGPDFIFEEPVITTGTATTAGQANSLIANHLTQRVQSVAVDKFGNIYIVEETDQNGPLPGVLMIPAGATGLTSDAGLARVDPNLPAVSGVATDAAGNLYIGDSKEGVFFVPNPSGTPETSSAVLLTSVAADGQVSIDQTRNILYVPTYNSSGAQVIDAVTFSSAELGSTATGAAAATSSPVTFAFSAATGARPVIQEAGTATPDFLIASGGTCLAKAVWAANSTCTVNVTLSPNAAGSVSAKLLLLNPAKNVVGSITLHGTGTGAAIQVLPGAESTIGGGLQTPSQVAVDAAGDTFVADSGLGAVELYPKASGTAGTATTVGTGLTAPTGVAADGAGDVFIADGGSVFEVLDGTGGLNGAAQVTLTSGLGTNLKLAIDGSGNLYVSDPDNHRVVKLGSIGETLGFLAQTQTNLTGFNAPSAIAVDSSENLYVVDGSNLTQVTPSGAQSILLTTLNGATGVAVDPSGSVYVSMPGGTVRIPNESGTLNPADQTMLATNVTNPTSVAIDSADNVYITDGTAEDVEFVSASASTDFGTQPNPTATESANYTILNVGNAALNFTGFSSTPDFSATATTCSGSIAVDATCFATVTFNPGPGDQGNLSGQVLVEGGEANSPVGVNVVGIGAALAASKTTMTVTNPSADGTPVIITVAPASGTGPSPTGQVTLTITGGNLSKPVTLTGTLASGTVMLSPAAIPAGSFTYAVSYQGDRVYGSSTASEPVTVALGVVALIQPTMAQVQAADPTYPYILAAGAGAQEPYDGSVTQFEYNYEVQVVTTTGAPLIGLPVISNGKQVATNYGSIVLQGAPSGNVCGPYPVAADGTATFATDCLTINTTNDAIPNILTQFTLTPMYTPAGAGASAGTTNPNYTAVTGTSISFTALRNPMVQISSSPSSLTISAGSSATATLTLSSILGYGVAGAGALLNNWSLPVQLACDGLPAYATCSFSYATPDASDPQSVDVGPAAGTVLSYMGGTAAACTAAQRCTGPGTVVMTINTNVPTGAVASLRRGQATNTFAAMLGLGLLSFAFGKKKSLRGRLLTLTCLVLCCGIMGGITGCSTKQLGTTTGTPSPAGTYTVTVTAKQVGSQTITQTPGIVYGNQNQVSLPFTMNVTIK